MQPTITNPGQIQVLPSIPFQPDLEQVMLQNGLQPEHFDKDSLGNFFEKVHQTARPAALYRQCRIGKIEGDCVQIEGVSFHSRVLRKNLEKTDRVFAFLATCGPELEQLKPPGGDMLFQFLLDAVKGCALSAAREFLFNTVSRQSGLEQLAEMSPGSAEDAVWNIKDQKPLFSLFQSKEKDIGVQLTQSFLMIPSMTISGLVFPSDSDYHDCRLCRRENCRSRNAEYDPSLRESMMGQ
jgi:hypothetical protein